jgi:protein-tyrosine phosphatase
MIEVTQVWERLYLGARNDAERLYRSNPHGITSVMSICEDAVLRRNPSVNYLHIPIRDATPVGVGQFDAIMDAIAENIRWGTVLVHCGAGVSRTPILAAAWMYVVGYKNIDAALIEIRKLRPIVSPSPILLRSVKEHLK